MRPLTIVFLAAAVGGCGLGLPASRPLSGEGDVVATDVPVDIPARDAVSPRDVTDESDDGGPIFGMPDVAHDVADDEVSLPETVTDASDVTADANDAVDALIGMDTLDVNDVVDALDVTDVRGVADRPGDSGDVTDVVSDTVVTSCVAPRADCDQRYDTGCETDTTAAARHCGACGNACLSNVCRNGVCWNVAGAYDMQDLAFCGAACVANTYTGACTCPAGYAASTLRRLAPCSLLANPTTADLSLCGSLTPGTFGGVFQNDPMCALACVTPNAYTGTCACPAGTAALMNFELLADTTCGRSRAVRTYLCGRVSG